MSVMRGVIPKVKNVETKAIPSRRDVQLRRSFHNLTHPQYAANFSLL